MHQSAPLAKDFFSLRPPAPQPCARPRETGRRQSGVNGLGHRRLRLILALTSIAFVIVVGRAVQVQVFESSQLCGQGARAAELAGSGTRPARHDL